MVVTKLVFLSFPGMEPEERALAQQLGASLRKARLRNQLTQAQLAERVNASVNHLSCLETGDRLPSLPMLLRLASALGTSVGALLGEEAPGSWVVGFLRSLPSEVRAEFRTHLDPPKESPDATPSEGKSNRRVRHPKAGE